MNTKLSLNEIKETELSILKYFRDYCRSNDIKFFLSNGTLLGAVKYNGFIPWDDDIDVLVPREDYNKLIQSFKDTDKYSLFSHERNPDYEFAFAKLCDMTTWKSETNIKSKIKIGIDIDIFPLDYCSDYALHRYPQFKLGIYHKGCMISKLISSKGRPLYKRFIVEGCKLLGVGFFQRKLLKTVSKLSLDSGEYAGCLTWPLLGKREIVSAEAFSDVVEVEFEREKFPAPIGYDTYLRSLYGEYENDPPIEQQKSHHHFTAYRL